MVPEAKKQLAHVLWIGGVTDSGKSTVARNLAPRYGASVYHYDKDDAGQIEKLARIVPEVNQFLKASLEERWVQPAPQKMFEYLLFVFPLRFPLVLENLLAMPKDQLIIVDGFGLLPELVQPVLLNPHQAIWFVSTDKFKWGSMTRRGKPSFAANVSGPEKARMNIFTRDRLLADYYRQQVPSYGYTLLEVDGSNSADEMTDLVETHFLPHLAA